MKKQNEYIILAFILVLLIPISNFQYNNLVLNIENDDFLGPLSSVKTESITNDLTFTDNNSFLPNTNLSITEYLDDVKTNTFNTSILSLNDSHIEIRCDYSITHDILSELFTSPFFAAVNRTGQNDSFHADGYYNWYGLPQKEFDFWIDITNFELGYKFESDGLNLTVDSRETITMHGVGDFKAWRLTGTIGNDSLIIRYDSSGLLLSMYLEYGPSIFWYNLTFAEIANLPQVYQGPSLVQISPHNESIRAPGTQVIVEFSSPYGIYEIYYQWDDSTNLTSLYPLPSTDGKHDLYITTVDNLGLSNNFHFVFYSDSSLPGIFLQNIMNGSKLQSSFQIRLSLTSSNGSFIYNWNGTINDTLVENSPISISNSSIEGLRVLNIYVVNPAEEIWVSERYVFIVDNTPPSINYYNFQNGSTIRGIFSVEIGLSEIGRFYYFLNSTLKGNKSIDAPENETIVLKDIPGGTYILKIQGYDSANNTDELILVFKLHVSSFDWNWQLESDNPRTIDIINDNRILLFELVLTSKSNQTFSLTIPSDEFPPKSSDLQYVVQFICDRPEDIIFITFILPLNKSNPSIPLYQWVYWDNSHDQWIPIETAFNEVSYSWEATIEGNISFFALKKFDEDYTQKTIKPGGGSIPGFELYSIIVGIMTYYCISRKKYRN